MKRLIFALLSTLLAFPAMAAQTCQSAGSLEADIRSRLLPEVEMSKSASYDEAETKLMVDAFNHAAPPSNYDADQVVSWHFKAPSGQEIDAVALFKDGCNLDYSPVPPEWIKHVLSAEPAT